LRRAKLRSKSIDASTRGEKLARTLPGVDIAAAAILLTKPAASTPLAGLFPAFPEILNFFYANLLWGLLGIGAAAALVFALARSRTRLSGGLSLDGMAIPGRPRPGGVDTIVQANTASLQSEHTVIAPAMRLLPVGFGEVINLPSERIAGPEGFIIGRDKGSDGIIGDNTVSKRHARIFLNARQELVIEDLGSLNGTWKRGQTILREVFGQGETVRFGNVEYRIELHNTKAGKPLGPTPAVFTKAMEVSSTEASAEWRLVLSGMDEEGHIIQFVLESDGREGSWTLGRKHGAVDLYLPHPRISSVHAQIRYRLSRGFEIRDLGSSNGTKVDSRDVGYEYVTLRGARKISFGDCNLNVNPG
jgi:pSer/pThr/pTyr-binding forkhead associated (FHA) protein